MRDNTTNAASRAYHVSRITFHSSFIDTVLLTN